MLVNMILKSDGDATPLGQRPLCVLPVVYRIWVQLGFVTWIVGFGLGILFQFFVLVVVVGLLMLGIPLLWTLRRSCLVLVSLMFMFFVADVIKSFDTADRVIKDFVLGRLGLPVWFRRFISVIMLISVSSSSLLVVLVHLGPGMGGIPQGCPLSMTFLLLFIFLCVGLWSLSMVLGLNCMLII